MERLGDAGSGILKVPIGKLEWSASHTRRKAGENAVTTAASLSPWNTIVGLADPGQMRSLTWNYVSARRRAFNCSVASFFVWLLKGARAVAHDFHGFGPSRPDVGVSVRWWNHADPTLWLEGVLRQVAVKSWNSFSACFYGLVSSIQKEKFFTPINFLWVIQFRHTWHLRYI